MNREKKIRKLIGKGSQKTNAERNELNKLLQRQFEEDFPEKKKHLGKAKVYHL